jgi:hypothetical protein
VAQTLVAFYLRAVKRIFFDVKLKFIHTTAASHEDRKGDCLGGPSPAPAPPDLVIFGPHTGSTN